MKIYLDTSCLKRPFDDQTQSQIRLETEAIVLILQSVENSQLEWYGSDVLLHENQNNPNAERRRRAEAILDLCSVVVAFSQSIEARGAQLARLGIPALDALHLASAEAASVEVFLTCDDQLLKKAKRLTKMLRVGVQNPVKFLVMDFLMEVPS